jgi:hypothetical protein
MPGEILGLPLVGGSGTIKSLYGGNRIGNKKRASRRRDRYRDAGTLRFPVTAPC